MKEFQERSVSLVEGLEDLEELAFKTAQMRKLMDKVMTRYEPEL
jgi:hypothetical protein